MNMENEILKNNKGFNKHRNYPLEIQKLSTGRTKIWSIFLK